VLRVENQHKERLLALMTHVIEELPKRPIEGHLWIVEEQGIRIRMGRPEATEE
jgi:hypothetical protein